LCTGGEIADAVGDGVDAFGFHDSVHLICLMNAANYTVAAGGAGLASAWGRPVCTKNSSWPSMCMQHYRMWPGPVFRHLLADAIKIRLISATLQDFRRTELKVETTRRRLAEVICFAGFRNDLPRWPGGLYVLGHGL